MNTYGGSPVPKCGSCKSFLVVPLVPKHTGHQFDCPVCMTEAHCVLYESTSIELTQPEIIPEFRSFIPVGEISEVLDRVGKFRPHTTVLDVIDEIRKALKI